MSITTFRAPSPSVFGSLLNPGKTGLRSSVVSSDVFEMLLPQRPQVTNLTDKTTVNLYMISENNILQSKFHPVNRSLSYLPKSILHLLWVWVFKDFLRFDKIVTPPTVTVNNKELSKFLLHREFTSLFRVCKTIPPSQNMVHTLPSRKKRHSRKYL